MERSGPAERRWLQVGTVGLAGPLRAELVGEEVVGRPVVVAEVEEEVGMPVLAVGKPVVEVVADRPAVGKTAGLAVVGEAGRPAAVVAEEVVERKLAGEQERKLEGLAEEAGRPVAVEDLAGRASSAGKEPERKRAAGQSKRPVVEVEEVQVGKAVEEPEPVAGCTGWAEAVCIAGADCTAVWAELAGRRKPDGLERAEALESGLCGTAAGQGRYCS